MAKPSKKSPAMEKTLEDLALTFCGRSRRVSIERNLCVWCGGPALAFKDELSAKEYRISGMCQRCQDKTFKQSEGGEADV